MNDQPAHSVLYEVNTRIWLRELSQELRRKASLDDVDDETIERFVRFGFQGIWLLGVWRTGEASRQVMLADDGFRREWEERIPGLSADDIGGSPFAIREYAVDPEVGDEASLRRFRARLNSRGIRLFLDFVPNHTAIDHPWVHEHPEFYVHGHDAQLHLGDTGYVRVRTARGDLILAHGKDPNFPAWRDTLQLNYAHAGVHRAMAAELLRVAGLCDGVRCDMAMLVLPDVFRGVWSEACQPADGTAPAEGSFWPQAIANVRAQYPEFLFLAEVYWNMGNALRDLGFDYTYDKKLYDVLAAQDVSAVKDCLQVGGDDLRHSIHFIENHDEPRAASVFPLQVHAAAAVIFGLSPGMCLLHEGQIRGRRQQYSIHLRAQPGERADSEVQSFYTRLLRCMRRREVQNGQWQMMPCLPAWGDNPTFGRFVAFLWTAKPQDRLLAAVNYGPSQGQCYIPLPVEEFRGRDMLLTDLMSGVEYVRPTDELCTKGVYLDVPAWAYHVFDLRPI